MNGLCIDTGCLTRQFGFYDCKQNMEIKSVSLKFCTVPCAEACGVSSAQRSRRGFRLQAERPHRVARPGVPRPVHGGRVPLLLRKASSDQGPGGLQMGRQRGEGVLHAHLRPARHARFHHRTPFAHQQEACPAAWRPGCALAPTRTRVHRSLSRLFKSSGTSAFMCTSESDSLFFPFFVWMEWTPNLERNSTLFAGCPKLAILLCSGWWVGTSVNSATKFRFAVFC